MRIVVATHADLDSLTDLTKESPPPGYKTFSITTALTRAYVEEGHQVRLVVQSNFDGDKAYVYGQNEALSVAVVPTGRALKSVPDWFSREARLIRDEIRAFKPDVVHAQWTYEYARGAIASGFPHLVTARDIPTRIWRMTRPAYYWWPKLSQGFYVARRAKRMSGQSAYTIDCWRKEMGRKKPMDLVPNAVPDKIVALGSDRKQPVGPPTFAFAASGFDSRKNPKTLLKAMQLVRAQLPDAVLKMYGYSYGPNEEAERWAQANGLAAGVEFNGMVPQGQLLNVMLTEVSALVHPSREESFGNSVAEGMALGLPVVGGENAGAVPWLLDNGAAGILCDVGSAPALAEAMLSALQRPELGPVARQRVLDHFRFRPTVLRYLEILQEEAGH